MKKSLYVILSCAMIVALCAGVAFADDYDFKFEIATAETSNADGDGVIEAGEEVQIEIKIVESTAAISSVDFKIALPEGITVMQSTPTTKLMAMYYNGTFSAFDMSMTGAGVADESWVVLTLICQVSDGFVGEVSASLQNLAVTTGGISKLTPAGDLSIDFDVVCNQHTWAEVVEAKYIVSSATCDDDAVYYKSCSLCGEAGTETFVALGTALGHAWGDWTETTAPTCSAKGEETRVCANDADHKETRDVAIDADAHTWGDWTETTAPTCSAKGEETRVCANDADHKETRDVAIDADAHTWGDWTETTAPTCSAVGKETRVCTNDPEHKETRDVAIDADAHTWGDWTETTAPTCSAKGEETRVCANDADHKETRDVAIDADAHTWGEWTVTTAPTCTEQGEKEHVCANDADHKESGTVPVDPAAHNYNAVVTAPTCTEGGYTTYTCANGCGHSYVADHVDANGHTDDPESESWNWSADYSEASCTMICDVCDVSTTVKAVIEVGSSTAKDCTEVGKTTYIAKATVNGVEYTDEKTVEGAAGPHDWSDWTVTTDPTCTEKGEATRVCSHNSDHKETKPVDATGHDYEDVVTAPTCTEQGYTTYTCAACGDSYVADYVDELGHNYESVVTEPTCTEQGYTTYTCAACGDSYVGDYVDELGHNYESVVTEPTCTEQGYTTYTCAACGDSYVDDYVDELGHTEETAATCASGAICGVCGEEYGEKDPANHSEIVEVEEEPSTCTTPGTEEHWECKGCGKLFADANAAQEITDLETLKLPLNPDNHTLVYKYDDNNHWLECADGDYSEKDTGSEPHSMGDWHIITNATSSKDGLKEKYCDTCDYTVQEKIPATGNSGSGSNTNNSDIPDTGDDSPIALLAIVTILCASSVLVLTTKKRKN